MPSLEHTCGVWGEAIGLKDRDAISLAVSNLWSDGEPHRPFTCMRNASFLVVDALFGARCRHRSWPSVRTQLRKRYVD
jgi:hypothetical protein